MSMSPFGVFPFIPKPGIWNLGRLTSKSAVGFFMSTSSPPSTSRSPCGAFPWRPNFGKLTLKSALGLLISRSMPGAFPSMSTDGASTLPPISGTSRSALIAPFGFFPEKPNFGICQLNLPDGLSTSISASGPSIVAFGREALMSPSGMSASTFGFLPLKPNLGKLKSNFPDGFSMSISRDGPLAFRSTSGPSTCAFGSSTSALGFLPLKPNFGR